ncbi:DUF3298 and DUF4163 domain-containing protein [Paenibacillus sp.]|jgi:hypothetical protein|uniref:DUF3298 and DUF4163 domain-containing protein n=1 Tax=Paenibacillus sp. TaxID=58172 RepID=UPI00282DE417|nr:DUF3298 and DUF4163 domain-containing protein [Paenibacillus sp.]MDR0268878.1 DUF3298 and DUF4163 domain-containing protein [Paenibacillus sp.]
MNKGTKWGAAVIAAGVLLGGIGVTGGVSVQAAAVGKTAVKQSSQPSIVLKYDGKTLTQQGKIVNGITLIPLTVLRDDLGLALSYNPGTKTHSVGSGTMRLNLEVSEYGVGTNLNGYYLESYGDSNIYEARNLDGHLYVPFKVLNDYMGFKGVWNPSLKSLELSKQDMNKINISSETITKTNKDASIVIHYPKVSGLPDDVQQKINGVLKEQADKFATYSEEQASKRDGSIEEHTYDFVQNFVIAFNREGVLSIVTDQYSYTGGAHGSTLREGSTFSLKDGKQLELSGLLKAAPDYKQKLAKMLKQKAKDIAFDDATVGLNKKPDFYLKEGGFTVFYQQYEIAPYAAGFPTYTFSFDEVLPQGTDPFAVFK